MSMSVNTPLDDTGILLHVLNILGPGHHLFISAVSKAWREGYKRVASVQVAEIPWNYYKHAVMHMVTPQTTLCSAVFASASRVTLAHEHGFTFDNTEVERIAGRVADVATLQAARELGLTLAYVWFGAAESASISKLQWLYSEHRCGLRHILSSYAARYGSIDVLRWLRSHGCVFSKSTCEAAAAGAHLPALQYLRDAGCDWAESACSAAAQHGHLTTLQWLHENGCPWYSDTICEDAAQRGNREMLLYLKQQGCEFNELTIASAAWGGHLSLCQYLAAEGCPWHDTATELAATGGQLSTLRWLHDNGCPWEPEYICACAAAAGSIEVLQYLEQHGCVCDAETMSSAASGGHTHICQYLLSEQCPWDASACVKAARGRHVDTLRWLHEHGCPWDVHDVRVAAVEGGRVATLEYLQQFEPAASAAQLTEMLSRAGYDNELATHGGARPRLAVAKWLRQHGAEWPAVLKCGMHSWAGVVLQWARDEGCTNPVTTD
jgi:hypothetical protein